MTSKLFPRIIDGARVGNTTNHVMYGNGNVMNVDNTLVTGSYRETSGQNKGKQGEEQVAVFFCEHDIFL